MMVYTLSFLQVRKEDKQKAHEEAEDDQQNSFENIASRWLESNKDVWMQITLIRCIEALKKTLTLLSAVSL